MARWIKRGRECCQHFDVLRQHEAGLQRCWCKRCGHAWLELPLTGGEI